MDIEEVFDTFIDDAETIANIIQEYEKMIQIIYSRSADAIIAASIFARVFYDMQRPCILTEWREEVRGTIDKRDKEFIIFIGCDINTIESLNLSGVVIALTTPLELTAHDSITLIHPKQYGFDNMKSMSMSATAYFICSVFAPSLETVIHLPLVSYQLLAPLEEYIDFHKIICDDASTGEVVEARKHLSFLGSSIYKVSESLIYTLNPFLPGITGNQQRAIELLTKTGIEEEIKGNKRTLSDLSKDEIRDLNSSLIVQLKLHKGYQEGKLEFIKTKTTLKNEDAHSITSNIWDFATAINDAIIRGKVDLAFGVLLGNRSDILRQLTKLFDEERRAVGVSYRLIQDNQDAVIDLSTLRYFMADYKISWYTSSNTAAMALSHGLVTPDLPFAVVAPGPHSLHTIGIRAAKNHNVGDLTETIKTILEERKITSRVEGTALRCQFSVEKEQVEPIMLDLNTKLKERME